MPKPYPIIYLPKAADQETLARALYRMGYRVSAHTEDEDAMWDWWRGPTVDTHPYPYISMGMRMNAAMRRLPDCTLVNSIPHFLAYTKSLGAPPQS